VIDIYISFKNFSANSEKGSTHALKAQGQLQITPSVKGAL
jgi:hypothetical protein